MNSTCEPELRSASALRPYPAYKDSGVEWLGNVPAHWDVQQLGRVGRFFKGSGGTKEDASEDGVPCIRYGDLYTHHRFFITESRACVAPEVAAAGYTPLRFGDVLFAGSGETIEEIGKSGVNLIFGPACCGGDVIICRPSVDIDAKFLGYATDSPQAAYQKARMGRGITVMHIYGSALKYLTIALPPLTEQAAIARFLDHADRRIRRYIRAKQKLIGLLEERKQAMVHETVTGQIDARTGRPYPAYKDSGVEWLRKIPAHWETRAFARCAVEMADYRGATPAKTEAGVFLVTAKNIRRGWIDYDTSKEFVAEDEYANIMRRGLPQRGDLLLTTEAPLGHAALVDREDIALAQRVIRFRLSSRVLLPEFTLSSVLDRYFQHQMLRRGTGSTALGIKASKLPQLRILCPPMDEQEAIVAQIAHFSRPLDSHRALARRAVELFREYRTRLVADVVPGKVDVRFGAAELPEADTRATEEDVGNTVGAEGISDLGESDVTCEEAEA